MRGPTARACRGVVLAVLGVAMLASPGGAHYKRVNYSYKNYTCEGDNVKDPVTVVYEGTGALAKRARADVQRHTGWDHDDPDTLAWASFFHSVRDKHTSGCNKQDGERANHSAWSGGRYHVRFFHSYHQSPSNTRKVFMTPHKELLAAGGGCPGVSHAVEPGHSDPNRKDKYYRSDYYSGFDNGRDKLVHEISNNPRSGSRHPVKFEQWQNTRSVKQCFRDWTSGSSGATFFIRIGR